jgi:hypothetical protein
LNVTAACSFSEWQSAIEASTSTTTPGRSIPAGGRRRDWCAGELGALRPGDERRDLLHQTEIRGTVADAPDDRRRPFVNDRDYTPARHSISIGPNV